MSSSCSSPKRKRSRREREPPLTTLPPELQEEILYRTPAENILLSRSMCKKWNSLVTNLTSNESFIEEHLIHSSSSSQRFLRTADDARILDPVRQRRLTSPLPEGFQKPICALLQCDGLVLCRRGDLHITGPDTEEQVAIWNPMLKGVRWIKDCLAIRTILGIGYKNRREGYMILSFPDMLYKLVSEKKPVRIYDLKKDSWRNIDNVKLDWVVDSSSEGVAAIGNMYWLAEDKNHERCIQCFDFTLEAFKTVCMCPPLCGGYRFLSSFSKDQLCLLHQEINSIEVWVSNKLSDETVSFALHFSVPNPNPDLHQLKLSLVASDPVYYFVEPKKFVAWCVGFRAEGEGYRTALYEADENGVRELPGSEQYSETLLGPLFFGIVYVPSLVPIWL